MSKTQKGNKEAKKPKQTPGMKSVVPALAVAATPPVAPRQPKRK
jgi:hypothetical protein